MTAYAAAAYVGGEKLGMLVRCLHIVLAVSVAWFLAKTLARASTTVKTVVLGTPLVLLAWVALIQH